MSEAELRQRNRKDLEDQLQDEDNPKIIQKVHVSRKLTEKNSKLIKIILGWWWRIGCECIHNQKDNVSRTVWFHFIHQECHLVEALDWSRKWPKFLLLLSCSTYNNCTHRSGTNLRERSERNSNIYMIFPGDFRCFAIDHGQMELQSKGRKNHLEQIEQCFGDFSVYHFSFECYHQHFCHSWF